MSAPIKPRVSGKVQIPGVGSGPQERLRFSSFQFARTKSGQCTAEVTLTFRGIDHVGRSIGPASPLGELRASAEACMRALEDFAPDAAGLELLGVKEVRAFDSHLAVVSIGMRAGGSMLRLVGCYLASDDVNRGAAIAVLNATNRVVGPEVLRIESDAG